jgi:hypothetical protein
VLNVDPTVKMLAIGMAFAVLIDASLVRMILVPSVMALLGEHAWWMPRWLEPIVPHLQLEGSAEPPAEVVVDRSAEAEVVLEAEAVLKAETRPAPPATEPPTPEPVPPAPDQQAPTQQAPVQEPPVPETPDQQTPKNPEPPRAG